MIVRIKANGLVLAGRIWGAATPTPRGTVVAIHGLTANHTCWDALAAVLAPEFRVIVYDLRGRGDSDKPARGYSLADHARDLVGVLDHFGLSRAHVMGHSLGAHIGVWFAAHYPERLDKLVLCDGGLDVRAEVLESLAPAVNRLGVEYPSLDAFLTMLRELPLFAERWNEHFTRYFTNDVEPGPSGGVRSKVPRRVVDEELGSMARTRLWPLHHRIAAPTLLFRAPDGLLTATDCLMTQEEAEAMARAIPHCRLVVVPATNHYTLVLGDDALVRRELLAFLRS